MIFEEAAYLRLCDYCDYNPVYCCECGVCRMCEPDEAINSEYMEDDYI